MEYGNMLCCEQNIALLYNNVVSSNPTHVRCTRYNIM